MKSTTMKNIATAALVAGIAGSANAAAVITVSASAPSVNGLDIANLVATTGGDSVWGDRPVHGQTFVSAAGGTLNAITIQIGEGDGEILGWKDYQLRFGTVDTGTNTIAPSLVGVVRYNADASNLDYFTFVLDTPIALTANVLYGFDVGIEGSQEGWRDGIPSIRKTGDNYAGGQKTSGDRPGNIDNTTGQPNGISRQGGNDLVFHLDIEAPTVIPTPSAALAGIAGLGMLAARRRRQG